MYWLFTSHLVNQWWFLIFSSLLACFFLEAVPYTSCSCCTQLEVQGSSLAQGSCAVISTTLLPQQNQTTTFFSFFFCGQLAKHLPMQSADGQGVYMMAVRPQMRHSDAFWCCAAEVNDKLLTWMETSGADGAVWRNHKFCKAGHGKVLQRKAFYSSVGRSSQRLCL